MNDDDRSLKPGASNDELVLFVDSNRLPRTARILVAYLVNRIDNAVKFAESAHASDAERVELLGMVAHLRTALEI